MVTTIVMMVATMTAMATIQRAKFRATDLELGNPNTQLNNIKKPQTQALSRESVLQSVSGLFRLIPASPNAMIIDFRPDSTRLARAGRVLTCWQTSKR